MFLAVHDRGTFDGRNDVPYLDRFHFIHMVVDPSAPFPNIKTVLLDTRQANRGMEGLATTPDGYQLVGMMQTL